MHSKFKIHNITVQKSSKCSYMDNISLYHRISLFKDYRDFLSINPNEFHNFDFDLQNNLNCLNVLLNKSDLIYESSDSIDTYNKNHECFLINSVLKASTIKYQRDVIVLNCQFDSSKVKIGENSFLNDMIFVII